jgi:pyoverdine/dityrosine biosynthesis protein Dit1
MSRQISEEVREVAKQTKRTEQGCLTELYGTNKNYELAKEKVVVPVLIKGVQTVWTHLQ